MYTPRRNSEGNTLLLCLGLMLVASLVIAAGLSLTQGVARNATRSQVRTTATQIGLGAIDMQFASWREIARPKWAAPNTIAELANVRKATMADFANEPGYTISNLTVTAVTPQLAAGSGTTADAGFGPSDATMSYFYLATADVTANFLGGPVTTKVRRIFEKQIISPWDYAIFYDSDLEIHPGATQEVTGWVHTNGVLYTAHSLLTFGSKVTDVGGWSIGFKPGDGQHLNDPPQSPNYQADIPPAKDTNHQPFGVDPWAVFALRAPVAPETVPSNDGWIELIKRPVTVPAYPGAPIADPNPNARYYNQADIRILVDASNNVTLRNINNREITNGVYVGPGTPSAGTAVTGKDLQLYNVFKSTAGTVIKDATTGIQDNRESTTAKVRLVTLDVSKITLAVNGSVSPSIAPTLTSFNGIVYIADTSASSSTRRGVKVKNADEIPNNGISIISENPVYIEGNVNTGTTNPPSNSTVPDPTRPTGGTYVPKPTLIAGDAINILSNAWLDTTAVASRTASNTTVNAAILGGIVPTGTIGTNYSGGAENFPRFLENWSGKYLTYYGSMVCLYESAQATGPWSGSTTVYSPPNRRWYFDSSLRQNPPPGNLVTINYLKDRWWTE